ncbi:possible SMC domain N terminal domain [Prochlorococcus marinus str. NATL1A]|uniref:Possible SMC domain N terminal domain n=1 Tax=Prochlorococcus marinus (strain NATL1A) TaxID=167555 RepID=A2C264_PROM1|nr:LPS export ABC transporter periplasmic protein LptC [Prochlorococcus marinus]ABM75574.1 possible SMC domain N terminal domain [Prochlorococcus marinus str. NATL1A]
MNSFNIYLLFILTIFPLLGCQKSNKSTAQIDNKSYINDFELLQENPNNDTRIKITSPKAIIDPTINDIEIYKSSIEIMNENGIDFQVESGNATLNNLSNNIRVFNNVNISFLKDSDYYISTDSFDWDLNTSVIDINNPLAINYKNTKINASKGFYNISSSILKIDNTRFNRKINNSEGVEDYQVEIKSDFAKWFKNDNKLVFTSNEKQVETTIKFLLTK